MDHAIENLGPERFQQLAQALLVAEFPNVTCFPIAQPDGGRDATQAIFDENEQKSFIVYQIKYAREPERVDDKTKWMLSKFSDEIEKIEKLISKGAIQYVLITNISGTSHLDTGSIDKTLTALASSLNIPVTVWWRDDLNRRLDGNWSIKLRYSEILSGHDFFRLLLETATGQEHERRTDAIRAFLAGQYTEDVEVKFKQVELHTKLLDLFIDLPFKFSISEQIFRVSRRFPRSLNIRGRIDDISNRITFSNASESTELSGTATLLLSDFGYDSLRQVVIEGAPGQGKSTLAQYLCQVHRIRILQKNSDLSELPEEDKQSVIRFPMKVDLRDLAVWLGGADPFLQSGEAVSESKSLETFLARLVRHNSGGHDFNVHDLIETSKVMPLLIVLDGLDEVIDIKQRSDVIAAVTKAMPRLRENCPDVAVIITSRPAAFANSPGFDPINFVYIDLLSVKRSQIDKYATKWMDVRGLDAKERAEFQSILKEKLDSPHLRDLARNPMQLTILLSLILTQGSALPDKRTSLYDTYVDLFFSRESAKSAAVRKHIDLLKDLHRYIGWIIHSTAETNRQRSSGRISSSDLMELLATYLSKEHHPNDIIEEIFGAMLSRVVMIVPRIQGTYEFEVQPLREYFAARYLYDTASYSPPGREKRGTKPDRFDAIARNFYWLNVVRFFSGCFSKGELLDLADRVKSLIADPTIGRSVHSVTLAGMLLSDWVFAQSPRAVEELMTALTTNDSLRKLAAADARNQSRSVIQIPTRSGAAELFSAAFSRIENPDLQFDQTRRIAQIIVAHGSEEQIDQRWMQSPLTTTKIARWLEIGEMVGSLGRAPKEFLLEKIGDGQTGHFLPLLLSAGRHDCVIADVDADVLREFLLSTRLNLFYRNLGKPPFYLLPLVIGAGSYLPFIIGGIHPEFEASFRTFTEQKNAGNIPKDTDPKLFHQCYALSLRIADLEKNGSSAVASQLIEECRQLWGERPAIILASIKFIAFFKSDRPKKKHFDILDLKTPLIFRLRAAKSKKDDLCWWKDALDRCQTTDLSSKLVVYASFFHFSSSSLMLRLADSLGAQLEHLTMEDWSATIGLLAINTDWMSSSAKNEIDTYDFSAKFPPRYALLCAMRSNQATARRVFLRYFINTDDRSLAVAEFRQIFAIETCLAGEIDWSQAREIVQQTYRQGAAYRFDQIAHRPRRLTDEMANDILRNADHFPSHLWDVAIDIAAGRARKSVRAVGRVARLENWFAN